MKYIEKNTEPQEFLDWKAQDKMYQRGKPSWNRVDKDTKDIIRKSLINEQGNLCCYCEKEINIENSHVEHFKPQGKNGYPEEQLNYDNLICSCQLDLDKGEPRQCGNEKGSWYDEELLVSPLDSCCEKQFKFSIDGYIEPADHNVAAQKTIEHLKLDIDKLNKLRDAAIEPFRNIDGNLTKEDIQRFIEHYLKKENSSFSEFHTTIQYLSQELISFGE